MPVRTDDLIGKSVRLRLVEPSDADFILSLRLDDRYNRFLSAVTPDRVAQAEWMRRYKVLEAAEGEFYFIIERHDGTSCGTVRIYDRRTDSFSWGSWILNEDKTRFAALESAFLVYQFGFGELGYSKSHFEVLLGNDNVIAFHQRMGALETHRDDRAVYFEISQESVDRARRDASELI